MIVCYWVNGGVFEGDRQWGDCMAYEEIALRRFSIADYTRVQREPSESVWMVPGTFENADIEGIKL